MKKEVIFTKNAPEALGPYVQGVKANGMLYLSGQLGINPATGELEEGVEGQAHMAMKNMGEVLKAGGASYEDVVKATIFLQDLNDFVKINAIYESYFGGSFPARSCVEVAKLPKGGLIEIEVTALLP